MSNNYLEKKMVIGRPLAWGTNVQGTKNHQFRKVSIDGGGRDVLKNNDLSGSGGRSTSNQVTTYKAANPKFEAPFFFNRLAPLQHLIAILGAYGGTDDEGVVTHIAQGVKILEPSQVINLLHSLAYTEGTEVKYIPSYLVTEFGFKYDNGHLSWYANCSGSHLLKGDNTMYNAVKALPLESYATGGYATFEHLVVKMNDTKDVLSDSEVELGESDIIKLSSLEVTWKRPAESDKPESGDGFPSIPNDSKGLECTVKIGFNRKDAINAAYFQTHDLGKSKKMTIEFTGTAIPAETGNFSLLMEFPRLSIPENPNYGMDTPTPVDVTFMSDEAIAVPTGFTNVIERVTIVNTIAPLIGYNAIAA